MNKLRDDFWRAYEEIRLLREQNVKLLSDLAYEKEYSATLLGEKEKLLQAFINLEAEKKNVENNLRDMRFDNANLRNIFKRIMRDE